jgi:hypothetical protein
MDPNSIRAAGPGAQGQNYANTIEFSPRYVQGGANQ